MERLNRRMQPETQMVSRLVFEMALVRRYVRTYPKNHVITHGALQRVSSLSSHLFSACDHFVLGVARDNLMINAGVLDRKSMVLRDLARTLFNHGIASVTFRKGFTGNEVLSLVELVNGPPTREPGQLSRALAASGVSNLNITLVDYGSFRITEEDETAPTIPEEKSLWSRFINRLLGDTPVSADTSGEVPPEVLAAMFNEMLRKNPDVFKISDYDQIINSLVKQLEENDTTTADQDSALDLLSVFVANLEPQIRELFLDSIFSLLSTGSTFPSRILSRFPEKIVLEILDNIRSGKASVPPVVLNLMESFAESVMNRRGERLFPTALDTAGRGLNSWMNPLFSKSELDEIDSAALISDSVSGAAFALSDNDRQELEDAKQDLAGNRLERKLGSVLQELIDSENTTATSEALAEQLMDQCRFFLEIGDFKFLAHIYERLINFRDQNGPTTAKNRLLAHLESPEFVARVLDSLTAWGKDKHGDIQQLILLVGLPFVRPMLDRMSEEENMSLRRYYLDRLQELGDIALEEVVNRLHDSRWYNIRNMLIILRASNNPRVLAEVHKLKGYSHPRIRSEVIRTLQHLNDPEADLLLLKDLKGHNQWLQFNAVVLARYSTSRDVFRMLLDCIDRAGYTEMEMNIRIAAAHSLSGFASHEAIPVLKRLLDAKHLLYMSALNKLKQEIIRSLAPYPSAIAAPLLMGVVKRGNAELCRMALDALNALPGEET